MEELPFYVYTWAYPDGEVFYVGMGSGGRYKELRNRNHLVDSVVRQLRNRQEKVQQRVIARFLVRQHAQVFERMLIEAYNVDHLLNIKSEDGIGTRSLAIPAEVQTANGDDDWIDFVDKESIMLMNRTTAAWEDDGAMI